MSFQTITATLSDADVAAIKGAITTIQQKLPFLLSLTELERKQLPKTGPNSLSFVEHAQTTAQNNANILPASFDAAGFDSHVALFSTLTDIGTGLQQLASEVDDTRLAVGSECMDEARQVYSYAKDAVKKTPGLKPVVDQLAARFQRATVAKPVPAASK